MDIYVARQPIFDRDSNLIGFELLYRTSKEENWASGADARTMSSDVIIHSVLNIGLERLTEGRTAFVNFTSDMLVTDLFELLDPEKVVIELLGSTVCDEYTVRACEKLAAEGYALALDDFSGRPEMEPIARLASIVKVDLLAHDPDALERIVASLREYDLTLVAEKIETAEAHERARALGFHLFQGYHLGRPEILSNPHIPVEGAGIIRVLGLLREDASSDAEIEKAFATSPVLSLQLLRIVSSASRAGCGIRSIGHALELLGRDMLHRWLLLLFVSSLGTRRNGHAERAMTAIVRARACAMFAHLDGDCAATGPLYLVGLLSRLDAVMQMPLTDILARIDLAPDIRAALLDGTGPYADTLRLVQAYEGGDADRLPALALSSGVSPGEIRDVHALSSTWARERMREHE